MEVTKRMLLRRCAGTEPRRYPRMQARRTHSSLDQETINAHNAVNTKGS